MIRLFTTLFFILFLSALVRAQSSVLANGPWLKIGVTQDGVYKIDATTLRKSGWNPTQINPQHLRLYGNGGAPLPQANQSPRPMDLLENSILVTGESDGSFDASDALYFIGKSPHEIKLDTLAGRFSHQLNPYSDTTFYFLTVGNTPGKRVQLATGSGSGPLLTTYDDYIFHEVEEMNRVKSGRVWYGESFYVYTDRTIPFSIPGALPNQPLWVTAATLGYSSVPTNFTFSLNGQSVGSQTIRATTYERYDFKGIDAVNTFQTTLNSVPSDGKFSIQVTYNRNGDNAAQGVLNYLGIQLQRSLHWQGYNFQFRSLASRNLPAVQMTIANAPADVQVWDLSTQTLLNVSNGTFSYQPGGQVHECMAFTYAKSLLPVSLQSIPNQHLHQQETPDLLIITAPALRAEAERLADFRRKNDQLRVLVVSTEEVFHEFSSGKLDPTALRDYARYLYQKKPGTLKYLLLFGDATYDYRNILKENQGKSFVPVYESRESLHPIYSYSSDDYFGFLGDAEGEWTEDYAGDQTVDIGIGRLPVKYLSEAKQVVDKLMHYEDPATRGTWQSKCTFVADDGDYNVHAEDAERLVQFLEKTPYQAEKIYLDAFPQIGTGLDQKSPKTNEAITSAMNDGRLLVAFAGHGGVSGWTQEQILMLRDILGWRNRDHLPLFLTATCEFGRYDDPGVVSGAELALLNAQGGAIGLITTARPVFASSNSLVSEAFMKAAFQPINGVLPRLGDLIRQTKNNSLAGRINRNFALLGDPSMRLAYASDSLKIQSPDTLRGGGQVTLSGSTSFDGEGWLEVYDQERTYQTLGDENPKFSYKDRKSLLYKGKISITQKQFSSSFILPTSLETGSGRALIRVYAQATDGKRSALGIARPFINGKNSTPITDHTAPILSLYMNTDDFKNGGETDDSPILFAQLADDSGLSYTELNPISAVLNDTLTINLNSYYFPESNKLGQVIYPFKHLPPGSHRLQVQAYDVFGNRVNQSIEFYVVPSTKTYLRNVTAMPNPFTQKARFTFEHDFQDDDTEITFYLYDLSGRLLHQQSLQSYVTPSPYEDLVLEKPELNTGLYIYRIFVRSLSTGRSLTGGGKISYIK
ncbi:type IX secretion system sortase PorU [Siphonobacter sp. SORGH_AS_1065]|uniref:type IX secretion system sortase PorU n=1 Tax=Siphonobacter sp. SORGH_AS_1065 TaxID=3041795 RepID=UPI0027824F1A|nr:type IX secretion system sortase PorU [Siphonobacter sp. SORGH_AS_1065]MDQ1086034.1 hypothetical protein [Siphonobacter sp. SORGH_AS_1065]